MADKEKTLNMTELAAMIKDVAGQQIGELVKTKFDELAKPTMEAQQALIARLSGPGNGNGHDEKPKMEKGLAFGRICRATALARLNGGGPEEVTRVLKAWGSHELAEQVTTMRQAAVEHAKALQAGDAGSGGYLVPPQYSQDIIEFLRPAVIVRALGPTSIPMPTGTVRIPKVTDVSTARYIGESVNIPVSQMAFGQVTLSYKKLVAMTPMSNDLVRYSSLGADAIVRDDIVRSMAVRENQAFLTDQGDANTPRGIKSQALPANVSAGADWTAANGANIIADAAAMILQLQNANVPLTRPAWMMSPAARMRIFNAQNANGFFIFRDELSRGTFFGYPLGVTTQMPGTAGAATNEVGFADFADIVVGDSMSIMVDASMEASYFDGTQLQSAYALDQTIIRAISEHDLGVRRAQSIAWRTGITV